MAEIQEPQNARSRRTRTRLLDAAVALLETDGFEALTMGALAKQAGISRRGSYLHFRSRSEVVRSLFPHVAARHDLKGSLTLVWKAPDAVSALEEWARHLARYHTRLLPIDRALQRVYREDPDAAAHRRRVRSAQRKTCRWLATGLAREGRLAPPWKVDTATDMLLAQISSEVIGALLEEFGWSRKALAEHLATMYRATFVADTIRK